MTRTSGQSPATMKTGRGRARWIVAGVVFAIAAVSFTVWLAALQRSDAATLVRLGEAARAAGDFTAAMAHFNRAVAVDPDNPAALQARGDAHYGVDDLTSALVDYDRAITVAPADAEARHRRAKTLLGLRREEELFAELDRALELDATLGGARRMRAWVRFNRGEYEAALRDLDLLLQDETMRRGEDLIEIRALRAEARLSLGDDAGALADLETLRAEGADTDQIDRIVVWALWGSGRYGEVLLLLDELLEETPRSANLQLARALTLMHLGRDQESLEALTRLRAGSAAAPPEADLFLWVAQRRLSDLSAESNLPPDEHFTRWHAMIAGLLRGEIAETDILSIAAAEANLFARARMQCEAFYYAGMKRLFEGDEAGGLHLLRRCVETEVRRYYEYHAAVAELRRRSGATDGD